MIRSLDPFQGLRVSGLLINTQKWIVQGDTHTDKARGFIGKGLPGIGRVREPRRPALPV